MADRPILFSGPMVRAQFDGRKTMTRRLLGQLRGFGRVTEFGPSDTRGYDWHFRDPQKRWHDLRHVDLLRCLPWAVGDRLWVREAWAPLDAITHTDPGPRALIDRGFYRADGSTVEGEISRWRPSIHMPRWASRLTDIVMAVKVERLQDISEEDAVEEGCFKGKASGRVFADATSMYFGGDEWRCARDWFADLWGALHGPDAWAADPWVVAPTFTVECRNIDAAVQQVAVGARP